MKLIPNTKTAMVKTHDVCVRVHPNSFSSGSTKMLHAYSAPSGRFMSSAPATRHHRLTVFPSAIAPVSIVAPP